jgi:hypothetical protein
MNARVQGNAARRIEWAILVLGLAGIAAIFVPFAYNKSPWGACRTFSIRWWPGRSSTRPIHGSSVLP